MQHTSAQSKRFLCVQELCMDQLAWQVIGSARNGYVLGSLVPGGMDVD